MLTHCNTGPLATAGAGTALGAIVAAYRGGKSIAVFACETRPLLQGARLTMYELGQSRRPRNIDRGQRRRDYDAAKRHPTRHRRCGSDCAQWRRCKQNRNVRARNRCRASRDSIYVAAPRSTFDFSLESGDAIPSKSAVPRKSVSRKGDAVYNPAFDVTPGRLVTAFITEYGIIRPPYFESIPDLETRPNFLAAKRH